MATDEYYRAAQISIHAPRVGSDKTNAVTENPFEYISIHAPRVGSDVTVNNYGWDSANFNPRSPCGERPDPIVRPDRGV